MSESQVRRKFANEPMGGKLVTALAGIGDARRVKLNEAGYHYAFQVLGKYLALNKDEDKFKDWLWEISSAKTNEQHDCYTCLRDWCNNFLNMSTTQKHKNFVAEQMGDKRVTKIAGIGDDLGENLKAEGFTYAFQVVGQYLALNKDEDKFKQWLSQTFSANAHEQYDCFVCVRDWCEAQLK